MNIKRETFSILRSLKLTEIHTVLESIPSLTKPQMAPKTYSIPKGSLILVTGANGYIGSNIIDFLLELDYNVRGTVRAPKPWLNDLFDKKYGSNRFETVIVPVLEKEGALDATMIGVSGIVHVVSIAAKRN